MAGPATPYSILLIGLLLIIAPMHPFGEAPWLQPAARRSPGLAAVVYVLGLVGTGYCIYGAISGDRAAWWLWATVPALAYWLLMTGGTQVKDGKAKDAKKDTHSGGKEGGDA